MTWMGKKMYERNLPPYLAHDLGAWQKGVKEKSPVVLFCVGR